MFDKIKPPVTLTTSLVKDTVTLGEPIVLQYQIANHSAAELDAFIGLNESEWADLEVRSETGVDVQPRVFLGAYDQIPPGGRLVPQGGPDTLRVPVWPGETITRHFVVSYWFDVTEPALYEIRVHVHLRYSSGEWAGLYTQDRSHVLEVLAADPEALAESAERLDQELDGADEESREWILQAALSLPEGAGARLWKKWLTEHSLPGLAENLIERLGTMGTAGAVAFLSEVAWGQESAPGAQRSARQALRSLAVSALPLKQRLTRAIRTQASTGEP